MDIQQWVTIIVGALGASSSIAWIFSWRQNRKNLEVDIESKETSIMIERRQLELDITENVIKELNARIGKQDLEIRELKSLLAKCLQDCAECIKLVQK